ncbi:MAG: tetratricopeptide repeat protein [Planctomycetaceae bacterium]
MPDMKLRTVGAAGLCLCALATGCVTTYETVQNKSTISSAGPGDYGQPVPQPSAGHSESGGWFAGWWNPKRKIKSQTHLAYARHEESMASQAAARHDREEQRAALAAARKAYEQVLADNEKSIDAIIGVARLDQVAGKTHDAEQGFLKAVRLDPNCGRAHDALGQFYADQKRWPEATQALQKAMAAEPDERSFQFHYAIALAKSGQVDAARPHLVESVGPAAAHYNLGVILHDQGYPTKAEEEFVAALVENPRLEQAQRWLKDLRREPSNPTRMADATANAAAARSRRPGGRVTPAAAVAPQSRPATVANGNQDSVVAHYEVAAPPPAARTHSSEIPAEAASNVPVSPITRPAVSPAEGAEWQQLGQSQ